MRDSGRKGSKGCRTSEAKRKRSQDADCLPQVEGGGEGVKRDNGETISLGRWIHEKDVRNTYGETDGGKVESEKRGKEVLRQMAIKLSTQRNAAPQHTVASRPASVCKKGSASVGSVTLAQFKLYGWFANCCKFQFASNGLAF